MLGLITRQGGSQALKPTGILSSAAQGVNSAIDIVFCFFKNKNQRNLFNESRIGSESWQKGLSQTVNRGLADT